MIKKLFFLPLLCYCFFAHSQTVKTDVLVIGAGLGGAASAIQCARSNVKAVLITKGDQLLNYPASQNGIIQNNPNLHSGFWGELRDSLANHYHISGSDTMLYTPVRFEAGVAEAIVKHIADSAKNLTIYLNTSFSIIKKDGDRWEVTVTGNKNVSKIAAKVVIDATDNELLAETLNLKFPGPTDAFDKAHPFLYRTVIATGIDLPGEQKQNTAAVWAVPVNTVIAANADNILRTLSGDKQDIQTLPFQLEVGQGVGATAAFCAYYKTTTKRMRIRFIQSELMNFKVCLLPITDVTSNDPNWRAIQQIAVTGLLNGVAIGNRFLFKPDSLVNTSEIKPVLIETYTRAFLWFNKEKPGEKFTVGNLLSFISDYTLTDPELLNVTIQKAWKSQFHFKQNFDLKRQVTRLEFAVLANKYLNPFARTIDLDGKLVN